jgi:hypothetical protein
MKKIILILLFIPLLIQAQTVKLTWSNEIENKKKVFISDIIHADNTGIYYTTAERHGGLYGAFRPTMFNAIEKISTNFSPIYKKDIPAFEEDFVINEIDFAKTNFLVFLSHYSRKEGGSKYYVSTIDMNGNLKGSPKQYLSITEENFAKVANLSISPSHDSTKFLVLAEREQSRHNKKEEDKISLTVFNNLGEKQWQKFIAVSNKLDGEIKIVQQQISPNGDVYLLLKEYLTEKTKETIKDDNGKKVPGYKYRIVKISNSGNTTKDYAVDLGKSYINSADLKINTQSNNVICSGFYNDQDNEVLKGLFYFEIDNSGAVVRKNNKDFPQEFVEEFKKNKGTKKDKKNNDDDDLGLAKSFRIDNIHARPDGGAYLISEFYQLVITTSSKGYTTYHYYSNDIIVVNIGVDGTIDWFHRIPKRQHEINQYKYSSYLSMVSNGKLFVLFNDNPRNLEIDDDEKSAGVVGSFKKTNCMLHIIDVTGKAVKQELFKNDEIETTLCPRYSRVIDENTIILYAEKGRNSDVKLGKIAITNKK